MSDEITFSPMAAFTISRDPADPCVQVLCLQVAARLGYLRAQDEWTDLGEPLPDELQDAAHELVRAGLLPEFEEFVS